MLNHVYKCSIHNYTDTDTPCPHCESERAERLQAYAEQRLLTKDTELTPPLRRKSLFLLLSVTLVLAFCFGLTIGNLITDRDQERQIADLRKRIYAMEESYEKFIKLTTDGLSVKGE